MRKLNLGIVGVLVPTKDETTINDAIKSLNGQIYWLPWGYRFGTLTKVCQYLYKNGYWTCTSGKNEDFKYSFVAKSSSIFIGFSKIIFSKVTKK